MGEIITIQKSGSFQESVNETLDWIVKNELEQVGSDLEIARRVYRSFPELVTAPAFPEPFRSLIIEIHDYNPDDNTEIIDRESLDPAALRETLRPQALEWARTYKQRTGRLWRRGK